MRRIALIGCLLLLPATRLQGQIATPQPFAEATPQPPASEDRSPWSNRVRASKEAPPPDTAPWHVDIVAGLPLAVRLQVPLHATTDGVFVTEAFAGLYLILPTVGAGVRYQHTVLERQCGRLTIGPGLDVYGLLNPFPGLFNSPEGAVALAADVEIIWQRSSGDRGDRFLGLKLGAAEVARNGSGFFPIVAIFGGWQF